MMDVDDGYILWTGIWKGVPLVARTRPILTWHFSSRKFQR